MAELRLNPEVELFREYLQISSVQPNVDYGKVLQKQYTYIHIQKIPTKNISNSLKIHA